MFGTIHSPPCLRPVPRWAIPFLATAVLFVAGCGAITGCGDLESEGEKPVAPRASPFAHLTRPKLGSVLITPAKNNRNFVREFPKVGEIFLVGVPVERLIGAAYGRHHRDIVFERPRPKRATYDAIVRPLDRQLDTAHEMLREAVTARFGIKTHLETRKGVTMVLSRLVEVPVLQPSPRIQRSLELSQGRLRAIGSPLSQLVDRIRDGSRLPVVDETGLGDRYDYVLEWDPRAGSYAFLQSLRDLGLKLTPEDREVEVLVVQLTANAHSED